jgi:hypothetical protein
MWLSQAIIEALH